MRCTMKGVMAQRASQAIAAAMCALVFVAPAGAIQLPYAGVNLAGYNYYGTGLPFNDVAHMGDSWHLISAAGGGASAQAPLQLTEDGYPAALGASQIAQSLVFTHNGQVYPTGTYALNWGGQGEVRLSGTGVSLVTSAPGQALYRVTSTNPSGIMLEITSTNSANPVRGIKLKSPLAEDNSTFNPQYTKSLANYGVIRFMDWNQTNNNPISEWSERVTPADFHWGSTGGVPYELQIQLCNEQRKDIWVTVPHAADDDYVRGLASLVQQNLSPGLRVWVEYSNEVWNGSFSQYHYADETLKEQYQMPNAAQAYGRRAAAIFDMFSEAIPDRQRLVRVIAGQTANSGVLEQSLIGATVNGELKADVAAVAPYFYIDSDPLYQKHISGGLTDEDMAGVFTELSASIDRTISQVVLNRDIAAAKGLPLVSYEAGQHLIAKPGVQANDKAFVAFLSAANRDPRMGEMYTKLMDEWYKAGGKTLTFFNDMQPWSKWGAWGLQESYLDTDAVKFKAVQDYLNRFRAPTDGMGMNEFELWRTLFSSKTDLRADLNNDGAVDAADYILLRKQGEIVNAPVGNFDLWKSIFGSRTDLRADLNNDGAVDAADYILLRKTSDLLKLAASQLETAGLSAVPEPSSQFLFLTAGALTFGFYVNDRPRAPVVALRESAHGVEVERSPTDGAIR